MIREFQVGYINLWELQDKIYKGKIIVNKERSPDNDDEITLGSIDRMIKSLVNGYPIKPLIFSTQCPEDFSEKRKIILEKNIENNDRPELYLLSRTNELYEILYILNYPELFFIDDNVTFKTVYDTFELIEYMEKNKDKEKYIEKLKIINSILQNNRIAYFYTTGKINSEDSIEIYNQSFL